MIYSTKSQFYAIKISISWRHLCVQILANLNNKCFGIALTGVAQVVWDATKQKITGLSLSRGTCLGGWPGPQLGHVREATDQCFSHTSIFLSLPSSLSKNK